MPYLTISSLPRRLDVRTDWSDKELMKDIPGAYWDPKRKTWHVPQTLAAVYQMRGTFGARLDYSDEVEEWIKPEKARMDYARYLARLTEPADGATVEGLYPWQVVDYQWFWTVLSTATPEAPQGCLLGNDQGTGKTISSIIALFNLPDALPALIICPNSVKRVWRDEIPKWAPGLNVHLVAGTAAQRKRIIADGLADPCGVIVINYEAVRAHSRLAPYGSTRLKRCPACGGPKPIHEERHVLDEHGEVITIDGVPQIETVVVNESEVVKPQQCHVHKKELNDAGIRTVILDEAQALADPKSNWTRACWAVCHDPSVTRRIAATGTPISNNMADLYGAMHAVQPDEYPVRSAYIARYGQQVWNAQGGYDIKGFRADTAPELFAFLDPRYRRITKAQAAPWLPPKVRSKRFVELPSKVRKAYDEMDKKLITRLDDGTILIAPSDLTLSSRLIQLASSYGTVEEISVWNPQEAVMETHQKLILRDPSPKVDELLQILSERGPERPLAVYAVSKQLLNLASVRLSEAGYPHALIHGDIHQLERDKALDDFQAGRLRCLLFNDAGGVGLTMTAADTIVRLQRSWSILKNLQCEDRVHRIGSEVHDHIQVIDIVAENTIEEWQLFRLWEKLEILEQLRRDGIDTMAWLAATGDDLRTAVYERVA
jgi:SNF2 family DNA or RNA helicase